MANLISCKHDPCNCEIDPSDNDGFCSDSCRTGTMNDDKCACGHPQCAE